MILYFIMIFVAAIYNTISECIHIPNWCKYVTIIMYVVITTCLTELNYNLHYCLQLFYPIKLTLRGVIEIVGVAGADMQWGHFVCPSSSQKRESTAFDLILRSAWGLSSPGKQVGRSTCSTPCRKRSQV